MLHGHRLASGVGVLTALVLAGVGQPAHAQFSGHNLRGYFGLQSASQPALRFYTSPMYVNYSTSTIRDRNGDKLETSGSLHINAVVPLVRYVSNLKIFGADYSAMATVPLQGNALGTPGLGIDVTNQLGLGDLYVQPINLGWHFSQVDVMAGAGVYAPTGRLTAGADDNTGLGMWSFELFGGATVFFDKDSRLGPQIAVALARRLSGVALATHHPRSTFTWQTPSAMEGTMRFKELLKRPRSLWLRIPLWVVAVWLLLTVGRFLVDLVRPYNPKPVDDVAFLDHAETQRIGPVRVTVSALGPNESRAVFGAELALSGIQPVWLEVENGDTMPLFYLQAGTDPEWFSPYETYWLNRLKAPRDANRRMEDRIYDLRFLNPVFPGQTHAGFIYTRLDEGMKALDLDLVGLGEVVHNFTFSVPVPGFRSDYSRVDFNTLYPQDSLAVVETDEELQRALALLPGCATNRAGDALGDPLNIVLIGDPTNVFPAFSRRGWHPTEQTYSRAIWRTIRSFIFRSRYRYSPVSPLYVFGRRQDIAAQKARGTIHLRNHARFWLTPIFFRGNTVWIGQISRDIGVRFVLGFPPTTHKIDPDVDEARTGLIQDLAYSQALARFAFVKGVGAAPRDEPRSNLTGDPYFTDGLRAVLFFEARPRTLDEVEYLDWERPLRFEEYEEVVQSQSPQGRPAADSVR